MALLGILLPLMAPAASAQVPRLRSASWVVRQYLSHRHILTRAVPDVLVCADGVPEEWLPQMASWVADPAMGSGFKSIAMRERCVDEVAGLDTIRIRAIRILIDSAIGELDAEVWPMGNPASRRSERYRAMPTAMASMVFTVDSGRSLEEYRRELAIRYDPLRHYLIIRRHLVALGGRPWIVICDESVPVSAVNDYVLGDNGRPYQYIMVHDPSCQVPTEVQRDTTLSAILVRKIEQMDGGIIIESTRTSASKRYPRAWAERFELMSDGRAMLRLGRFVMEPPH